MLTEGVDWEVNEERFLKIQHDIETSLVQMPGAIPKSIVSNDDKELLSFLAAKVIETKQDSSYEDPLGLTRVINLIS